MSFSNTPPCWCRSHTPYLSWRVAF
ncbi:hypothetical protein CGRA01v4_12419 [Colletotrichum graminicola]|nr:hypothetical protein CGRA01v4_12419 [Colletotrichum graminicola]